MDCGTRSTRAPGADRGRFKQGGIFRGISSCKSKCARRTDVYRKELCMRNKRHLWVIALLMVLSLVAAACGGDDATDSTDNGNDNGGDTGEAVKGGTIHWESE